MTSSNNKKCSVLVVGAGPAGLVLAIDLARRGVAIRIVEKNKGPSTASRAKGIQPRTLEIFHNFGIIEPVLMRGGQFPRWRSYVGTTLKWERSLFDMIGKKPEVRIDTPYPETFMIPQSQTEEILRMCLNGFGVSVENNTEFIGCTQNTDGVVANLITQTGKKSVLCQYLVGADGGHSAVRKALAIPFVGTTDDNERYVIADVQASALDHIYWHNWSVENEPARRISMCPMPHTNYFQFVAPILPGEPEPDLTLETLQNLFNNRSGRHDIVLSDLTWISLQHTNLRLASRFRDNRIFLAGDAAHLPPQAGGQGMNISIQDSINLSWKLAAVLSGAPSKLLDSYESERRPMSAALLDVLSAELQATGTCSANDAELRQQEIKDDTFHLKINYRHSPIVREARKNPEQVHAGDRAPDALAVDGAGQSVRLFDFMKGPKSTILTFSQESARLCADILGKSVGDFNLHLADKALMGSVAASIHTIYGISIGSSTVLLIRPDGYIGLAVDRDIKNEFESYLKKLS